MSNLPNSQQRFHFIDGYRAIAVTLTIFCHSIASNVENFLTGLGLKELGKFLASFTASGVYLFFIISGIVLLRPYLRNTRTFDVIQYFKKRFTRIYPTYFVALLLGTAIIIFINQYPSWYLENGVNIKFSINETVREMGLINFDGIYYNLSWWSLQVEVLFYILVPILVYRFPKIDKLNNLMVLKLFVLTLVITFCTQVLLDAYYPNFYSYRFRIYNVSRILDYPLCFLMGMMMAARDFDKKWAIGFMILGTCIFLCHWHFHPAKYTGWGVFYGGLLMYSFQSKAIQTFLSKPIFIWIGERSFSLFLTHLSVFYFSSNIAGHLVDNRGMVYGILSRSLGYILMLFISMLLFHLVERRFARGLITENMIWPWQTDKIKL